MGQDELYNYLRSVGDKKTRKQIADDMGYTPEKVSHIIKDLLRWGDIKCIELCREEAIQLVNYTLVRRTRFYFVEN
jgi:DNA-binding MarR family transcriptional regulator